MKKDLTDKKRLPRIESTTNDINSCHLEEKRINHHWKLIRTALPLNTVRGLQYQDPYRESMPLYYKSVKIHHGSKSCGFRMKRLMNLTRFLTLGVKKHGYSQSALTG